MEQHFPNLISKLQEALASGHFHHFFISDGELFSPFIPGKSYLMTQVHSSLFVCSLMMANLYTIVTLDGLYKGTMILPWHQINDTEF